MHYRRYQKGMIMKQPKLACVLSIAGTDPSGGAGIQADIKAISATGGYAATVITALVAQNTQGVQTIKPISADFVAKQLESVFDDLDIKAIKIGMLHDQPVIDVVYHALTRLNPKYVVLDPVMVAKDGSTLLRMETISLLKEMLFPLTHLITPNLAEAEYLLQKSLPSKSAMLDAAIELGQSYGINVLIKGGHLQSDSASDVLYDISNGNCHWFVEDRINTRHTHGTGCSLSSAITSYLAQGMSLVDAVEGAKQYVTKAIRSGRRFQIGKGNGPIDHFYFLGNRPYDS